MTEEELTTLIDAELRRINSLKAYATERGFTFSDEAMLDISPLPRTPEHLLQLRGIDTLVLYGRSNQLQEEETAYIDEETGEIVLQPTSTAGMPELKTTAGRTTMVNMARVAIVNTFSFLDKFEHLEGTQIVEQWINQLIDKYGMKYVADAIISLSAEGMPIEFEMLYTIENATLYIEELNKKIEEGARLSNKDIKKYYDFKEQAETWKLFDKQYFVHKDGSVWYVDGEIEDEETHKIKRVVRKSHMVFDKETQQFYYSENATRSNAPGNTRVKKLFEKLEAYPESLPKDILTEKERAILSTTKIKSTDEYTLDALSKKIEGFGKKR